MPMRFLSLSEEGCLKSGLSSQVMFLPKVFEKSHLRCISDLAIRCTRNNTCLRLCKANSLGLEIPSRNESVEPPQSEGEELGEVLSLSSWEVFTTDWGKVPCWTL